MLILADSIFADLEFFFSYCKTKGIDSKIKFVAGEFLHTHSALADADAIFIRSKTIVNKNLLKQAKKLKFIASGVAGINHLDLSAIEQKGIKLAIASGANKYSVVDYVLYHLLHTLQQDLGSLSTRINKNILIIGYGKIGLLLTKILSLFNWKNIKVYDPYKLENLKTEFTNRNNLFITPCELQDSVSQADIISIHCSYSKSGKYASHNLLNAKLLSLVKPKCIFINCSRGEVVDEVSLLKHVKLNKLRLILDVWHNEPYINTELVQQTLVSTTHIAGHSVSGKQSAIIMLLTKFCKTFPQFSMPQFFGQLKQKLLNKHRNEFNPPLTKIICYLEQRNLLQSKLSCKKLENKILNNNKAVTRTLSEELLFLQQLVKQDFNCEDLLEVLRLQYNYQQDNDFLRRITNSLEIDKEFTEYRNFYPIRFDLIEIINTIYNVIYSNKNYENEFNNANYPKLLE